MIEVLIAGGFLTAAVVAISRKHGSPLVALGAHSGSNNESPDLPCPWCEAPTGEMDDRCPSCGQRFG